MSEVKINTYSTFIVITEELISGLLHGVVLVRAQNAMRLNAELRVPLDLLPSARPLLEQNSFEFCGIAGDSRMPKGMTTYARFAPVKE